MKSDFQIFKEAAEKWISYKEKSVLITTNPREDTEGFDICVCFSKDLNQQTFIKYIPHARSNISFYRDDMIKVVTLADEATNNIIAEIKQKKWALKEKIKGRILEWCLS